MGDMGEYWKDVKPYLKERRAQHVNRMGNSALKNVAALGFEFKHYSKTSICDQYAERHD